MLSQLDQENECIDVERSTTSMITVGSSSQLQHDQSSSFHLFSEQEKVASSFHSKQNVSQTVQPSWAGHLEVVPHAVNTTTNPSSKQTVKDHLPKNHKQHTNELFMKRIKKLIFRRWPSRCIAIMNVILLLFLLQGLFGWLSSFILLYTTGEDMVQRSSAKRKIQMSLVVDHQLSELIKTTSFAVNQVLYQLPDLNLNDDLSWIKIFANLQQLYLYKLPIQISYFARFDQSVVGAEKLYARRVMKAPSNSTSLVRDLYEYRVVFDRLDQVLNSENLLRHVKTSVDMKSRPWYSLFVKNLTNPSKIMWSPFFKATNGIPSITACIPIYITNETTNLVENYTNQVIAWNVTAPRIPDHLYGVIGIQLNVKNISDILTQSAIRAGVAASFIINSEGHLVAATKFLSGMNSQQHNDPIIIEQLVNETIAKGFLQQISDWRKTFLSTSASTVQGLQGIAIQQAGSFVFQSTDTSLDVFLFTVTDPYGLNWGSVIAVPQRLFVEEVFQSSISSVVIFAGVLCLGLVILITVVQCIQMALRGIKRQLKELVDFKSKWKTEDKTRITINSSTSSFSFLHDIRQMQQSLNIMRFGLEIFSKYVPEIVAQQLCEGNDKVFTTRYMSVMIMNIYGFSLLAETTNRVNFISQSSELFTEISEIVERNKGVIDKYLGDRIVAVWNEVNRDHSVLEDNHEIRASKTALQIRDRLQILNSKWRRLHYPKLSCAFSVNSGEFLSGNIGSLNSRVNFTVIGDCLNVASALEKLNCKYKTQILMGEATHAKVKNQMICYFVDCSYIKGKFNPIKLYSLETGMSEASQCFEEMEKCFFAFNFSRILEICEQLELQQLVTPRIEGIIEHFKQRSLKMLTSFRSSEN
ncbi:hypothetical protein C9374_008174 [Naegleria lovaniensis]|uniref:Guanylate cyclase domain-containing protein n=1 Tax=Naegleria lovaniensis TaxID=51637 RepID=A0AA88KGD3_NAELO|nr:uncharacterized protein C9374_008174 [Naegleria lovaniensis]KAG2378535.1 hypothetical protein C9374_008174 [Naegleria lovaniensis]